MPQYTVSIIIPTLGRPAHLERCLQSIAETVRLPHEIICVVSDEDAETGELLDERAEDFGELRVVVESGRSGFVRAANLGMKAAGGDYLTIINDDCELLPHTIDNAVRFMEAPAHLKTIGQAAFFHNAPDHAPLTRNIHQQIMIEDAWYYVRHVRGLCYANFGLVRRTLAEELDWFDERYRMYGADPDFSLKVWREAKLIVAPCPGALVRHVEVDDDRAAVERAGQDEDNRKLFEKWGMLP
jgi:GT2 family glycosyltransferase